jgi:hypothetical protein
MDIQSKIEGNTICPLEMASYSSSGDRHFRDEFDYVRFPEK